MKKKISIIIPFFNEKDNLPILLNEVKKLINSENKYDFELLLMDNNSNDGSNEVAKNEIKNFKDSKYIKLSRNFGYQANIKQAMTTVLEMLLFNLMLMEKMILI